MYFSDFEIYIFVDLFYNIHSKQFRLVYHLKNTFLVYVCVLSFTFSANELPE